MSQLKRGLFISFEGIDGAGKSTHIEGLAHLFREQGRDVVLTREPGGTPLAERLRELVLHEAMDPLTEALLVFAARRDHLVTVIEPALAKGSVVICDRFTDATFAYQGAGRGFDLATLTTLEQWVQTKADQSGLRQPDLSLWFDLPPAVAAERLAQAREADRFEAQSLDFFERVRSGYQARFETSAGRMVRINADQSKHLVWQHITHQVVQRGWLAIMVNSAAFKGNVA
ncbi:dTMP kinase [Comamonadaceae bacterium M7527]|nr:dTMP kinase [Comamonadaceae bacterium M7527]